MNYQYNDGGRNLAGFKGKAGDCVCRAIAIATGIDYLTVYNDLSKGRGTEYKDGVRKSESARNGINVKSKWFKNYIKNLGFTWIPLMKIGTGCKVHLTYDELPKSGKYILRLSGHCAAYIDGVLHDTYDCSRNGGRCVYGYWKLQ